MLTIALPKGRLALKVCSILEKIGYDVGELTEDNRKLICENKKDGVKYLLVKPSDVPIYVERGAADVGVAGKDILLEYGPEVYELLDLGIGKCTMAVAAPKNYSEDLNSTLRVATKFVNIAKDYYRAHNRNIEIIKLNGSIELAPLLNLSDVIVDLVETGSTLRENDLEVITEICSISARFIANKTSFNFKSEEIEALVQKLKSIT